MNNVSEYSGIKDHVIVISGASSGIGRQCAIACSEAGAMLALFGRDKERLNKTLSLTKDPDRHSVYAVDIRKHDQISSAIEDIVSSMGRISGMVSCAGISTTLPFKATTPGKMEEFMSINVIGAINMARDIVRFSHFDKEGGSIIFISSVMGLAGESGKTLYSMTKGALISASRSMAIELAPRKIRVNCISPGVVDTPMSRNAAYSRDEVSLEKIGKKHPLGLGRPEDVAGMSIYLLSDAARWVTGSNLVIDGGYMAL